MDSELVAATINNRELRAWIFHVGSLARQFQKPNRGTRSLGVCVPLIFQGDTKWESQSW
jgi:hypothetical protein